MPLNLKWALILYTTSSFYFNTSLNIDFMPVKCVCRLVCNTWYDWGSVGNMGDFGRHWHTQTRHFDTHLFSVKTGRHIARVDFNLLDIGHNFDNNKFKPTFCPRGRGILMWFWQELELDVCLSVNQLQWIHVCRPDWDKFVKTTTKWTIQDHQGLSDSLLLWEL